MANFNDLINIIKINQQMKDEDLFIIGEAYKFAENAHRAQKRISGEDYIQHSLKVAIILAKMKSDFITIAAGLLHDVPEDTNFTLQDIEKVFGKEISSLVEGITKLGKIKYRGIVRYAENLRKMFIAMAADIRTILIKLADRIHNLKTINALPHYKQQRIALETLEIYSPIANRLGIGKMRDVLENLAFPIVYPQEYEWVKTIISEKILAKEKYLKEIQVIIKEKIQNENIKIINCAGRIKKPYSLWKKLQKYNNDISKIYDLIALRIIVENISDCYIVLGIIHNLWKPLSDRIKDYIAKPKPNHYQSIHTTVFCEKGEIVEFQIQTLEMFKESEYGVAAHWYYKEKENILDKKLSWVKELVKWQKEIEDNTQYLKFLKSDIFQNRIFVFTPKGDVIDLPEDSTPIDFAFHIHTDLGNKCVRAKINDRIVNLDAKLKNGDVVEIIIDKNRKKPSPDWLKFVKTNLAYQRIKKEINK